MTLNETLKLQNQTPYLYYEYLQFLKQAKEAILKEVASK